MYRDTPIKLIKEGFPGQRMVYVPGATKKKILGDPKIQDLYITHIGHFPKADPDSLEQLTFKKPLSFLTDTKLTSITDPRILALLLTVIMTVLYIVFR